MACWLSLLALVSCRRGGGESSGVQLIATQEPLTPGTTFELRFDQPVAAPAALGQPAARSPLVIEPAVAGRFVWLTERVGAFTPETPLALDTAYRFSLARDLRDAVGRRLAARLERTLRTPGFTPSLLASAGFVAGLPHTSAQPALALEFNAAVEANRLAEWLRFRRPGGLERRAVVVPMNDELLRLRFGWYRPPLPPWEEVSLQVGRAEMPPGGAPTLWPLLEPPLNREYSNVVYISPATPLDVGAGWELVLPAGTPALRPGVRLRADWVLPLGTVQPLTLDRVEAHNVLQRDRRLELRFSKALHGDVTSTNLTNWIRVRPAPQDLQTAVRGSVIELTGAFEPQTPVRLTVQAGLPAEDSLTLAETLEHEVRFPPVPPRFYFPAFSAEQYAAGRREFPLLAVNTTQAFVRAKLIEPEGIVQALRGYDLTFRRGWREPGAAEEPFREVSYALMPGRTVFDQRLALEAPLDQPRTVSLRWDDLIGPGRRGVVFLDARRTADGLDAAPEQGAQALVQVTDLGLVTKASRSEVVALAFRLSTGQPVSGALIQLLTGESEVLAQAQTDAAGLVRLPQTLRTNLGARFDWRFFDPATDTTFPAGDWVLARTGDDARAAELRAITIPSNFGDHGWRWSAPRERWRLLAFTERPAYRPGETARLKVIAREWHGDDWRLPAGEPVKIELADPRGRVVVTTNGVLGDLASLDGALPLPAAPLGDYSLNVSGGDASTSVSLTVQEFKPNAFEVTLEAEPEYRADESPASRVSARYLHGQPLSRARVVWTLEGDDVIPVPAGWESFRFGTEVGLSQLGYQAGSFMTTGATNLAPELLLAPEVPINPVAPHARRCRLLVSVTDLNQQSVAQELEFLRHSSDFYLGVQLPADVARAGEPLAPRLAALGADGHPWPARVPATLTLKRVNWNTLRVELAGSVIGYRNEAEVETVAERAALTEELVRVDDGWEATGEPSWQFTPETPGQYVLEARATDPGGRPVFTAVEFHVFGDAPTAWAQRNETQLELVADQPSYAPGDTALLLVKTPLSGPALVSVERDRVLRAWVTNLTAGSPVLEVPLVESDAPNVQVVVVQVRGAEHSTRRAREPEFRAGGASLRVTRPDRRLTVVTTLNAAEFRPGDAVRLVTQVADQADAPLANAEVTLFAVDEGVLSLTGYTAPDPCEHFAEPRAMEVQTGITLPGLLPEDPADLRFQNKGFIVGGGGAPIRLRTDFRPVAFWAGQLRTDAAGRVEATFRAPDSLTQYRVVAVAHTATHQFGQGEAWFTVNKPLMLDPALPQFANVGDQLVARAVVFNRLPTSGEVEVTLQLDDRARPTDAASLRRRFALAAQSAVAFDVPVEFVAAGEAVWTWRARFVGGAAAGEVGDFTDAVESRLPVGYPAPLLREVRFARVAAGESNLLADVSPQLLAGTGRVSVRVANTRLGELREAVSQLIHYPYGCTEQVTSTLLPLLALRRQPAVLAGAVTNLAVLDAMIRSGLERLLARQTSAGGFAYWPAGPADLWVSAYATAAIALARAQGFAVADRAFQDLLEYLRAQFVAGQTPSGARRVPGTEAPGEAEAQCLALYALALGGKAEAGYHQRMRDRLPELPSGTRAWLALAIAEAGPPSALAEEILTSPVATAAASPSRFGDETSDLAARLLAWIRIRPEAPEVDRLVGELLAARTDGHWLTTQGNAWSVLALTAYAHAVEGELAAGTGGVAWATRETFALAAEPATREFTFSLEAATGRRSLLLSWPGPRPLFSEVVVEARPPVWRQPRQEQGLAIRREYARLDETNGVRGLEGLRGGDRVLVTLVVQTATPAYHLVVDDPLPAVLEAVNPAFSSQATGSEGLTRDWVSDRSEVRSDRVLFFSRSLGPGSHVIRYLARVCAAGTTTAPAAKVEAMYQPTRFGLTETTVLTAEPAD